MSAVLEQGLALLPVSEERLFATSPFHAPAAAVDAAATAAAADQQLEAATAVIYPSCPSTAAAPPYLRAPAAALICSVLTTAKRGCGEGSSSSGSSGGRDMFLPMPAWRSELLQVFAYPRPSLPPCSLPSFSAYLTCRCLQMPSEASTWWMDT